MSNILAKIQAELKVPKSQFNKFGNYKYRKAEDILEAVKPLLSKEGYYIILTDNIIEVGGRIYVQATATVSNGSEQFVSTGFAREEESKKGMDGSQVTGASSSYARKYALNGLFAIDDTRDSDETNTHEDPPKTSMYNHKDLGTKEKPLITNAQFKIACDRLKIGDYEVYQKVIDSYSLESKQQSILSDLFNQITKQ